MCKEIDKIGKDLRASNIRIFRILFILIIRKKTSHLISNFNVREIMRSENLSQRKSFTVSLQPTLRNFARLARRQ